MNCSDPETILRCRKAYVCEWCGEEIDAGSAYVRWFVYSERICIRVHPECHAAMNELEDLDEWDSFCCPRGCNCGGAKDCPRCEERMQHG